MLRLMFGVLEHAVLCKSNSLVFINMLLVTCSYFFGSKWRGLTLTRSASVKAAHLADTTTDEWSRVFLSMEITKLYLTMAHQDQGSALLNYNV